MTTKTSHEEIFHANRPLPSGWRWVRLGEVSEIIAGQSPPGQTYRKRQEGLPFFQGKADFGYRYPVPRTWCIAPNKIALPGDILISVRAPVGPTNVADVKCCIGRGLAAIRPGSHADRDFVLAALRLYQSELAKIGSGSTFQAINREDLESLEIPLPSLPEQTRIAAILNEQMAVVEQARAAANAQLEAAKALPAAYLRTVFTSNKAQQWRMKRLGEVCEIQLGKMLSPASKVGVRLRPYLRNANVQWGRVDLTDVAQMDFNEEEENKFALKPGDLLVCEGGEPGRAAVWDGRISPCYYQKALHRLRSIDGAIDPYFIMYRLWMGALQGEFFGSHAKTTIAHLPAIRLHELPIRIPALSEQRRISARLSEQMAAVEQTRKVLEEQLATINALPGSLLRGAFSGELTQQRAVKAQPKLPKGIFFKRAAIAAYIINRLHKQSTFGRVQFEKALYLTEAHVGIDLTGHYKREAAGPLDSDFLYKLESLARKRHWFTKRHRGAEGFFYRPGPSISDRLGAAETIMGDRRKEMDRLLDLFEDMDTEQAEILSTLFAAWNDFLQDGLQPTDEQIIQEVREHWHSAKERFTTNRLQAVLDWMREHQITPRGIGPRTEVTNGQA